MTSVTKEDVKKLTQIKNFQEIYFFTNPYNSDFQQFTDWVHEFMPKCKVTCKDGEVGANGIIE